MEGKKKRRGGEGCIDSMTDWLLFYYYSYSIVIQHGKEIIAIVAVKSKEHATSATPLIVSAALENHSFLIDTVVIILPTSLPRSRFGEKQRDKTLAAYVEKKL